MKIKLKIYMDYFDKRNLTCQALSYFIPQRESALAIAEASAYGSSSAEEAHKNFAEF